MNRLAKLAILFAASAVLAVAQAPAPAAAVQAAPAPATSSTHSNELGFTYTLPTDWEVVDSQASIAGAKQQASETASSDDEKKGLACVQLLQTARHGTPGSVIVEIALPFDCFGQQMSEKDLPGFASGASTGLKQSFDLGETQDGSYTRGAHSFFIERAKGSPIGHAEVSYTVEIACSILKKAAVCWMTMAADDAALQTFEQTNVTLDGEAPAALVPANAFAKKPS